MKATVTKLCEPESVQLPKEMLTVQIDPQQVEANVARLSLRYADLVEVQTAQKGDCVHCRIENGRYPDGRTVLLYTDIAMPGGEAAAQDAVGKNCGEEFSTSLAGEPAVLTVEKIIRPVPREVNDSLIASMGIEDVKTVEDYRAYTLKRLHDDAMTEKYKMATAFVQQQMIESSAFEYDEAELESELGEKIDLWRAEYLSYGMEVSDDDIRQSFTEQQKQLWLAKALCRSRGITLDRDEVEAEAKRMLEMYELMGETIDDKERFLAESLDNAYLNELFSAVEAYVSKEMEG